MNSYNEVFDEVAYGHCFEEVQSRLHRVLGLLNKHKKIAQKRNYEWAMIMDLVNARISLNSIIEDLETTEELFGNT